MKGCSQAGPAWVPTHWERGGIREATPDAANRALPSLGLLRLIGASSASGLKTIATEGARDTANTLQPRPVTLPDHARQ